MNAAAQADVGPERASLGRVLNRLTSLSDGDSAVPWVVAFGKAAVPHLRPLLFRREPSGLFQARCRVVDALAALRAQDVLLDFLNADREIDDPLERAGEDAVINATARALRDVVDEAVIQRLLFLCRERKLAGPIEVLGALRRAEALPCLIAALEDDVARPAAEDAIRRFGRDAIADLTASAGRRTMHDRSEPESSRRRRRSSLALLLEITGAGVLELSAEWIDDDDNGVAVLGCSLQLQSDNHTERRRAVLRLLDIWAVANQGLRFKIEDCLFKHACDARPFVSARVLATTPDAEYEPLLTLTQRRMLRLARYVERAC